MKPWRAKLARTPASPITASSTPGVCATTGPDTIGNLDTPPPHATVIELSCVIDAPIAEVFAFHLDTRNAARISPPSRRIVSVEGTFPLAAGSEVRLKTKQRPLPFAQAWHVRIARVEQPTLIVDQMLSGPFAFWLHEHRFDDLPGDRTRLTDHLSYALPAGPLGRVADRLLLRRLITRTFRERHARTQALFAPGVR
jgi:ligand-binding SRPBCC domain-containing protein